MSTLKMFVAVHAGAGYHSLRKEKEYTDVCRIACVQAMELLKRNFSAVDAVTEATVALENAMCTNAGMGSSLTLDGTVECDAGIMDGQSNLFGGVGAVEGVQNPIRAAQKLVFLQQEGVMSLGRIPPSVLVGPGARKWCNDNAVEVCDPALLVTDSSKRMHLKYLRKMETQTKKAEIIKKIKVEIEDINAMKKKEGENNKPINDSELLKDVKDTVGSVKNIDEEVMKDIKDTVGSVKNIDEEVMKDIKDTVGSVKNIDEEVMKDIKDTVGSVKNIDEEVMKDIKDTVGSVKTIDEEVIKGIQDTVGAICVDYQGNVAASSSSGGLWLKHSGRIGPAAVYGAGCWAKNRKGDTPGVAVSTSGTGEDIMKCLLGKTCGDSIQTTDNIHEAINIVFKQEFIGHSYNSGKNGGVIALKTEDIDNVELIWAHTTNSMCIGYYSTIDTTPKTFISRLPKDSQPGFSLSLEGKNFDFNT